MYIQRDYVPAAQKTGDCNFMQSIFTVDVYLGIHAEAPVTGNEKNRLQKKLCHISAKSA